MKKQQQRKKNNFFSVVAKSNKKCLAVFNVIDQKVNLSNYVFEYEPSEDVAISAIMF